MPLCPKVMPFGPTNASACMQCFMNHIFTPLHNKYPRYFENYMDNCSIMMGPDEDELYRKIILEFLQILHNNYLFLWLAKCIFEQNEINFLSMHLNYHGITINPSKLVGLCDWPHTFSNIKEVCKVLSILEYQQPFIPNFTSFARPFTNLPRRTPPLTEPQNATKPLTHLLTLSPCLQYLLPLTKTANLS